MKYFFYVAFLSVVCVFTSVAQKQKDYKMQQAEALYIDYRFQEALDIYRYLLENTATTDSAVYSEISSKVDKATMAVRMLSAVEDVEIIDSIRVNKADFFSHYQIDENAGRVFSNKQTTDSISGLPLTGYMSQRQAKTFTTETLNNQTDIFTSHKLFDGWTSSQALSSVINTTANENFPFMLSDGITFYYCSDGDGSIGGYDIFITRFSLAHNDFMLPENLGMPFNSPFNDYLMVIDELNEIGWFATDRYQQKDTVILYKFKATTKRSYLSAENQNALIEAAQFKKYKLYTTVTDESDTLAFVPIYNPIVLKNMQFVINDSLVYTAINQFTSEEAKKSYEVGLIMQNKVKDKELELEELRYKYAQLTDVEQKKQLFAEIQNLEVECGKIRSLPNDYFKKARNTEIKNLLNKH